MVELLHKFYEPMEISMLPPYAGVASVASIGWTSRHNKGI